MASATLLVCKISGTNELVSEGGACTISLSVADMRNSKIATNQPVGVIIPTAAAPASDSEAGDSVDALADRLGYALDLDKEQGCATMCIACAWPSPKLANGCTVLSKSLYESLARPEIGASVTIRAQAFDKIKVEKVYARLLYNLELERIACLPPVSTAKPSPTKTPPKPQRKSKEPGGGTSTASAAASTQAPGLQESTAGAKLSPASLEWLLDTVTSQPGGASSRTVLQKLLLSHWHKRWFLNGNIAVTPLLGRRILFQIFRAQEAQPDSGGGSAGNTTALQIFQLDAQSTQLDVLPPGAEVPSDRATTQEEKNVQECIDKATKAVRENVENVSEETLQAVAGCIETGFRSRKKANLSKLAGIDRYKPALHGSVQLPLLEPQFYEQFNLANPHGLIMHGPPGTGKSMLAYACANDTNANFIVVNGAELRSNIAGENERSVRALFKAARALTPCILFLDDMDNFCATKESKAGSTRVSAGGAQVVGELLAQMDELKGLRGLDARVVVIGATTDLDAVDPILRRPGKFDQDLEVGVPTPKARVGMLEYHMSTISHNVPKEAIKRIAEGLHGFVAADIYGLAQAGAMRVMCRYVEVAESESVEAAEEKVELVVTEEDLIEARKGITPSAMKEVQFEVPNVSWDDIGGLEQLKESLKKIVEHLKLDPEEETTAQSAPQPKGVLLFGPPGCSKTMLARAMATQGGLNFLHVRGSDIYSKYVGESEKAVARAFARARQAAPSILFVDEIDTVVYSRDSGDMHEVYKRVLGEMLQALDGIKGRSQVLFLAATNRPGDLDSALLRPGRLDRLVYVPPPDDVQRESILRAIMRKMAMGPDVDPVELARMTDKFTGADLQNLCREAGLAALGESFDIPYISMRHFHEARRMVRASPDPAPELMESYRKMRRGKQAV